MNTKQNFSVTNLDFLFKSEKSDNSFRKSVIKNLEDLNYSYADNFILLKVAKRILVPFGYYFLGFLKLFLIFPLELDIFLTKKIFGNFNFAKKRLQKLEAKFLVKYFNAFLLIINGQIKDGSIDYKEKEKRVKLLNKYLEYTRYETFEK